MKDRIKKVMENEGFGSDINGFADTININRQTMNTNLGRNKEVSISIVQAILDKFDSINAEWLLRGRGPMRKGEKTYLEPSLFDDEEEINLHRIPEIQEYAQENILQEGKKMPKQLKNKEVTSEFINPKKIDKITIFYTDNTFINFTPEN